MKRLLVVLLLCSASISVFGQSDGVKLLQRCELAVKYFDHELLNPNDMWRAGFCIGYVAAVEQTDFAYKRSGDKTQPHLCIPQGADIEQGVRVVLKWLQTHPAKLHFSPA